MRGEEKETDQREEGKANKNDNLAASTASSGEYGRAAEK